MMATAEERMKVLQMIREGKITAEEGAKLLSTLTDTKQETRRPINALFGELSLVSCPGIRYGNRKNKNQCQYPVGTDGMGFADRCSICT